MDEWDKIEKKVMDEIDEVTEKKAFKSDSFLTKVMNKQEDELLGYNGCSMEKSSIKFVR